jgi:hypothetical protein
MKVLFLFVMPHTKEIWSTRETQTLERQTDRITQQLPVEVSCVSTGRMKSPEDRAV